MDPLLDRLQKPTPKPTAETHTTITTTILLENYEEYNTNPRSSLEHSSKTHQQFSTALSTFSPTTTA
jgi:hypothetical protein